jgi:hypothetical protein
MKRFSSRFWLGEVMLGDGQLSPSEAARIQSAIDRLVARGVIQVSPVFISYSQGDSEFVDALGTRLDDLGVRYWRDTKDAVAGRLGKVIEGGMAENPTVLLVLSEHSVASDWVEFEVGRAVELSKKLGRDVLCPVALDDSWLKSDRPGQPVRVVGPQPVEPEALRSNAQAPPR